MYSVYYFSDQTRPGYLAFLNQNKLHYETGLDYLRNKIAASGSPGVAVVPDTLVNALLRNHVDYIIRGNLRLNPSQKTNRVINTVHRYMYYIEQKYPGIFTQVTQVGGNNDEPAQLFRIQWEIYGLDSAGKERP
jgi:type IV secretory pathway ATPase VirB11/archaellum biosynthesis ATPase